MSGIVPVIFSMVAIMVFLSLPMCEGFSPVPQYSAMGRQRRSLESKEGMASSSATSAVECEECIEELLAACRAVGQVGYLATPEERELIENLAQRLAPFSESEPAKQPLEGFHDLVYSAAEGSSSGRLVGPIYGTVTQEFVDDEIFINAVKLGPLHASLRARRKILDDQSINVKFLETTFKLFGNTVLEKEITGGGVWKYIFYGKVKGEDGKDKLIRVMEAPSLFVLEQPL